MKIKILLLVIRHRNVSLFFVSIVRVKNQCLNYSTQFKAWTEKLVGEKISSKINFRWGHSASLKVTFVMLMMLSLLSLSLLLWMLLLLLLLPLFCCCCCCRYQRCLSVHHRRGLSWNVGVIIVVVVVCFIVVGTAKVLAEAVVTSVVTVIGAFTPLFLLQSIWL